MYRTSYVRRYCSLQTSLHQSPVYRMGKVKQAQLLLAVSTFHRVGLRVSTQIRQTTQDHSQMCRTTFADTRLARYSVHPPTPMYARRVQAYQYSHSILAILHRSKAPYCFRLRSQIHSDSIEIKKGSPLATLQLSKEKTVTVQRTTNKVAICQ